MRRFVGHHCLGLGQLGQGYGGGEHAETNGRHTMRRDRYHDQTLVAGDPHDHGHAIASGLELKTELAHKLKQWRVYLSPTQEMTLQQADVFH
eukprot:1818452-Amphidinium_carterae.1